MPLEYPDSLPDSTEMARLAYAINSGQAPQAVTKTAWHLAGYLANKYLGDVKGSTSWFPWFDRSLSKKEAANAIIDIYYQEVDGVKAAIPIPYLLLFRFLLNFLLKL